MELKVENLGVARGGIPVLEGLSFVLSPGRALILRGPNGIGKTTLLRTIAGLQPPLAGRIGLDREAMAYAAHADGLKATLSVEENLQFWAKVFGTGSVEPALEGFALQELRHRPAGALSAGQKRRLGLARLLVTGRPVWVLDEPTVSLDIEAVAMFGAAIRAHLKGGGMALIATHIDVGLAEAEVLDVGPHKARARVGGHFDEVFL